MTTFRSLGQFNQPSATSPLQCWTTTVGDSTAHRSLPTPGTRQPAAKSNATGSCGQYAEFAPKSYDANGLPPLPIKTVRIMFHIMQKDDGTENFQSRLQDGGLDEAMLRAFVGSTNPGAPPFVWPQGSGNITRSLNDVFRGLSEPIQLPPGTPWPTNPGPQDVLALDPLRRDTRIQFYLEGIRYYRHTYGWDMSNVSFNGCGNNTQGLGCMDYLHNRYVTQTSTNPGANPSAPNQVALTPDEQNNVIHLFFGEHPGTAAVPVDQYGVRVCRYQAGGAASSIPGKYIMMRGAYWSMYHHPLGAVVNPPATPQNTFQGMNYVMAHELGHCLGLGHTFGGDPCVGVYQDPIALPQGKSNNIMDYPELPGLSLSQCQIGEMHDALSSGTGGLDVDVTQVRDHWTRLPGPASAGGQDNVIAQNTNQIWNTIHNLRGDLYVDNGATLTIQCRVGFLGPTAKIVVRNGGHLILDGGTIGNYATAT